MTATALRRATPLLAPSIRRPLFRRLAGGYVRRRLTSGLDGVHIHGLDLARSFTQRRPVIFAANHVSWWDAMLLVALDDALQTRGSALMDARNLRRLPFMGWLGALPIDRTTRSSAQRDLERAADHLQTSGDAVWIFPQGRQRPAHLRPLGIRPGVVRLAERSGAAIIPVAFNYTWATAPQPRAWVDFGPPLAIDRCAHALTQLETAIAAGLSRIDLASDHPTRPSPFKPLIHGRNTSPEHGLGARILRRLGRAH